MTFGEPFGSLEQSEYHPWIETIIGDLKSFAFLAVVNQYRIGRMLSNFLIPAKAMEDRKSNFQFARDQAMKRLAITEDRLDFLSRMTKPGVVSEREYIANALSLIGPGSETTATLLTGATYYLLKHPATLKNLTDEVRAAFSSPEDVTFIKVANLKYLAAVIDESLRLYPVSCLLSYGIGY